MKKLLLGLLLVNGAIGFGQDLENRTLKIDVYGNPVFSTKTLSETITTENFKLEHHADNFFGPFGLRVEKMVRSGIGFGGEIIWSGYTTVGQIEGFNGEGQSAGKYDLNGRVDQWRILFRTNYYFLSNEHFEFYGGGAIGAKYYLFGFDSDYPDLSEQKGAMSRLYVPLALKAAVGTRYFFSEHIGLHAELALGGPLLTAGVSAKF